jgi:hypothetical protein
VPVYLLIGVAYGQDWVDGCRGHKADVQQNGRQHDNKRQKKLHGALKEIVGGEVRKGAL